MLIVRARDNGSVKRDLVGKVNEGLLEIGEVHERCSRLHEPVRRPVDRLAVMRAEHGETDDPAMPLIRAELLGRQQLMDGDEVAERLAHLLAFHLQEAVVHPYVGHHRRAVRTAALRDLVLVMREDEVDAAAVDVEHGAEVLL